MQGIRGRDELRDDSEVCGGREDDGDTMDEEGGDRAEEQWGGDEGDAQVQEGQGDTGSVRVAESAARRLVRKSKKLLERILDGEEEGEGLEVRGRIALGILRVYDGAKGNKSGRDAGADGPAGLVGQEVPDGLRDVRIIAGLAGAGLARNEPKNQGGLR